MTAQNLDQQKYIVQFGTIYPVLSVTHAKSFDDAYAAHEKKNGCGTSHTFYLDGETFKSIGDVLLSESDAEKEAAQQRKNIQSVTLSRRNFAN